MAETKNQTQGQTPERQLLRMVAAAHISMHTSFAFSALKRRRDYIVRVELRVIRALTAYYALFLLAEIIAAVVGRP